MIGDDTGGIMLGMKDEAVAAFDRIAANRGEKYGLLRYLPLKHLPIYDSLRDDPRFQEILQRKQKKYEAGLKKYSLIEMN